MANDNGGIIGQLNVPTVNLATGVWSIDSQYQAQKSGTWPLGYPLTTIDNSLRFNSGSSDSLTKTTTTPDNRDKLTLSAWFKISSSSTSQEIFGFYGSNDYFTIRASNSNRIDVILYDGSAISRLITTQLLRDFSAWYHIVVVVDSANATADDRVKIYLNGNQITSFSTRTSTRSNLFRSNLPIRNLGTKSICWYLWNKWILFRFFKFCSTWNRLFRKRKHMDS
jgi:hypothetical protein